MKTKVLFSAGLILSIFIAVGTLRFIPLGLPLAFQSMLSHIELRPIVFLTHILAGSVALAIGGFQLWDSFRQRRLAWHRWGGRVYVLAVLFAGIAGLILGVTAPAGIAAQVGFTLLAILWLITTIVAIVNIRAKKIKAHQKWMYRSFALTFSAVTLRLQLILFFAAGVQYGPASLWLAWTAWVPNIILVEWWIRRSKRFATA